MKNRSVKTFLQNIFSRKNKHKIAKGNDFVCLSSKAKVFVNGENNRIFIEKEDVKTPKNGRLKININGNRNIVKIENGFFTPGKVNVDISGNDITFIIGANAAINDNCHFFLLENGSKIELGSDCMFAADVKVWNTDAHAILDENDKVTNVGKSIKIGNHVWVGMGARIGKNVEIPDGCVVGWGSVVSRKFSEKNAVIAGNPARVVKVGVHWVKETVAQLLSPPPPVNFNLFEIINLIYKFKYENTL